jgi:antitoxin YxxD
MTERYSYLKKYLKGTYFLPVSKLEIEEAELQLKVELPIQLKDFYNEIGAGILSCGERYPEMLADSLTNEILPPLVAANFSKGILRWDGQDNWMSESTYELLEPGDLPFFEIGDSTRFLIMKLYSDNPNAIWAFGNIKIEDSFEKFIWRLYYESPWFYDDIIEAHYKNLSSSLK